MVAAAIGKDTPGRNGEGSGEKGVMGMGAGRGNSASSGGGAGNEDRVPPDCTEADA